MRQVIRQKIVDSIASKPPPFTPRDVRLPAVRGKAVAVIGMRRSGKTTFLWQVLAQRLARGAAREGLLRSYRLVRGVPGNFYMYSHLATTAAV